MMKRLIVTSLVFGLLGAGLATALTARAGDPPDQKKHAVLDAQGTVVNIVEWDGKRPYDPGKGLHTTPYDPSTQKYEPVPPAPTYTPTPTTTPLIAAPVTTEERLTKLERDVAALQTVIASR